MPHIPLDSTQVPCLIWVVSVCETRVELENWRSVNQMMQTMFSAPFDKKKCFFYIKEYYTKRNSRDTLVKHTPSRK